MTHVRPFGLQCSEAMSIHARLVKFNPSMAHKSEAKRLGRQQWAPTPWLTERHGYDPTLLYPWLTLMYCVKVEKSLRLIKSEAKRLGRQQWAPTPWLTERHG